MAPLLAVAPFALRLLDRSGQPAPCVPLRTVDQQVHLTDPDGWVAFHEPGLMDQRVWFTVEGEAFSHPADFFGYRGFAVQISEGGSAEVRVDRVRAPGPCAAPRVDRVIRDGYTDRPFDLQVVDAATGRGVPLIRVDGPTGPLWTDSGGHVAIREPGLLGTRATLAVADLHGYRPAAGPAELDLVEGGSARLEVIRDNVSERLYRVTGRGVYRDTVLLGLPAPTAEPVLDGRVMGQDTIHVVPTRDGWMWMYGDTLKPDYPLGLFDMAGALARPLPDPADGVDLDYYEDRTGFVRAMAPVEGDGPTWITGPLLVDDGGVQRVADIYGKYRADLTVSDRGLVVWDPVREVFQQDVSWGPIHLPIVINPPIVRGGVHFLKERFRFPATLEAARDPTGWEVWTPLLPDGSAELRPDGEPWYRWRVGVTPAQVELPLDEVVEHATEERVMPHQDSVAWSPWRRRWHRVFTQQWGTISFLGEMWYAEADTPFGPWTRAAKIATHDGHTSYNPQIHVELETDGRELLWQATYTTLFAPAGTPPTPMYDYNQVMYRLDLEDPRLVLPVPVYDRDGSAGLGARLGTAADLRPGDPEPRTAFLAPDRPFPGSVPVSWDGPACDGGRLVVGPGIGAAPAFHLADPALPPPVGAVPLWRASDGADEGWFTSVPPGFAAEPEPLGYVWPNLDPAWNGVLDWLAETRVEAGPDLCLAEEAAGAGAALPLDASASPGTAGGAWSIALDGAEVAAAPAAELRVPAGRHVVTVRWTSPAGSPAVDEVLVAVARGPGPADPADTGSEAPPTDGGTGDDPADTGVPGDAAEGEGCGCGSTGAAGALSSGLAAAALALGRRGRARRRIGRGPAS